MLVVLQPATGFRESLLLEVVDRVPALTFLADQFCLFEDGLGLMVYESERRHHRQLSRAWASGGALLRPGSVSGIQCSPATTLRRIYGACQNYCLSGPEKPLEICS
jgi:hypothetical protein